MQYIFLLYGDESMDRDMPTTPEGIEAMMKPWIEYTEALEEAGVYIAGEALQPTEMATTLTTATGETVTTDGPYAATKEQLGGFYLVNCKDLDEALHWAAKCPGAAYGNVEVRPIMTFDMPQ